MNYGDDLSGMHQSACLMTFLNISQKPGETISAYTERFVAAQEDLSRIGIVVQPDFLNSMLLLHKSSSEYNANKKVLVSEKGTLSTLSVINRLKAAELSTAFESNTVDRGLATSVVNSESHALKMELQQLKKNRAFVSKSDDRGSSSDPCPLLCHGGHSIAECKYGGSKEK